MKKIIALVVGVLVLGVGYWLISPLFINKTVDEELPINSGMVVPGYEGADMKVQYEPGDTRPADGVEPLPLPTGTNLEEQVSEDDMVAFMEAMKGMEGEDTEMSEDMPMEAYASSRLPKTGFFEDVAHEGSGEAKLLILPKGELLVRLENLDVLNGPDLRVLLSKEQNVRSSADLGEYIELGKLKGNKGNQNYEVPEGIEFSEYHSVIIYCKPFSVVFNSADLE